MEYRATGGADSVARLLALLNGTKEIRARWQLAGDFYTRRQAAGTLLVEDNAVHFFVWDENPRAELSIVGSFNLWRPGEVRFARLAGTPLLHASLPWHPYDSFRYLLAQSAVWRIDPLCRETRRDGAGKLFSYYSPVRETWPAWAWEPGRAERGRCTLHTLTSRSFRDSRPVLLYTTPGAANGRPWQLLIVAHPVTAALLPVYANLLDNVVPAAPARNLAVVLLPVNAEARELPPRGMDWLDLVKQDLSPLMEKAGWPLAGAAKRLLLMHGRGAGFLLLSLFKEIDFLQGMIIVEPDPAPYEGLLRYYARLRRPGFLKKMTLVWADAPARTGLEYVKSALQQQGIARLEQVALPPAPDAAPDAALARLERQLRLAMRHLSLF